MTKKIKTSQKDYQEAVAGDDPTQVSKIDLQDLAKEAVKKFKSME